MPSALNPSKIPQKYWYDGNWLALDEGVTEPTFFHILGVDPAETNPDAIKNTSLRVYRRIQEQSKNKDGHIATALLNVIGQAQQTLCDAGKRQEYVALLQGAYRTEIQECLRSNNIKSQADVDPKTRDFLLGLREGCSLAEANAVRTLEEELSKLDKGAARPTDNDPTRPNHFHLLEVPESVTDSQQSLVEQNADRLAGEWEQKSRTSNRPKQKTEYAAKAKQIRQAADVLLNAAKREAYKAEIRERRQKVFQAHAGKKVIRPDEEIPARLHAELIDYAVQQLALSERDADQALEEYGYELGGTTNKGRLAPLPGSVNLGAIRAGATAEFSFELRNVGQAKVKVRLNPNNPKIRCDKSCTIPPNGHVIVNGRIESQGLDAGSGHRFSIAVFEGKRSRGNVDLYVTITVPQPTLRVSQTLDMGRQFVGQIATGELIVGNDGEGMLDCRLTPDQPWVLLMHGNTRVAQVRVPGGQEIRLTATIDLRKAAAGRYASRIAVASNGGSRNVQLMLTAAMPKPGHLELNRTVVHLGKIDPKESRTVSAVLSNTGDVPIGVAILLAEGSWLSTECSQLTLQGSEKKTVEFVLRPGRGVADGSGVTDQVLFRASNNESISLQVGLTVEKKPGAVERYSTATAVIAPMILLPGLIGLFAEQAWVREAMLMIGLFGCPIGIVAFRAIWCRDGFKISGALKACGAMFVALLIASLVDWIGGGIVRWILRIFVSDIAAARTVGVIMGLLAGGVLGFAAAYLTTDEDEDKAGAVAVTWALAFALACAIGGGFNALSITGTRWLLLLLPLASGIGAAVAYAGEPVRVGRRPAWVLSAIALPACLVLVILVFATGPSAAQDAAAHDRITYYWDEEDTADELPVHWGGLAEGGGNGEFRLQLVSTSRAGDQIRVNDALLLWKNESGYWAIQRVAGFLTPGGDVHLRSVEFLNVATGSPNWSKYDLKGKLHANPWKMQGKGFTQQTGKLWGSWRMYPIRTPDEDPLKMEVFRAMGVKAAPPAERRWTGTWDATYGTMLLMQSQDGKVSGTYGGKKGTITGTASHGELKGTWKEPNRSGQIEFTMSFDGNSFTGRWRSGKSGGWQGWKGTRKSRERPAALVAAARPTPPAPTTPRRTPTTPRYNPPRPDPRRTSPRFPPKPPVIGRPRRPATPPLVIPPRRTTPTPPKAPPKPPVSPPPDPPRKPTSPSRATVRWDVPGWEKTTFPRRSADPMGRMCSIGRRIKVRKHTALVGLAVGPKASGKHDTAYEQFKRQHLDAFASAVRADKTIKTAKVDTPLKKTCDGLDHEWMFAQKLKRYAAVTVTIKDGRCVAYWFMGDAACNPAFWKGLKLAVTE